MTITELQAGTTTTWSLNQPLYNSSLWKVTYFIRGPKSIDVVGVGTGFDYVFDLSHTVSAEWPTGVYKWQSFAEKLDGSERHFIASGSFKVTGDIYNSYKGSEVKQILDAIDATIKGVASKEQRTLVVGVLQLEFQSLTDLIKAREYYAKLYNQELNAESVNANRYSQKILTRFTNWRR